MTTISVSCLLSSLKKTACTYATTLAERVDNVINNQHAQDICHTSDIILSITSFVRTKLTYILVNVNQWSLQLKAVYLLAPNTL